jgi:hypothetical protein
MAKKTDKVTGGCLCGAVRYEADEPPRRTGICHCRMCQKANGGPFAVGVYFRKAAFRFTRGEAALYRSSDIAERGFCAACGSRLIYRPVGRPILAVEVGSLDDPNSVSPEYHTGVEGWLSWLTMADDLPRMRTDDNTQLHAFKAAAEQEED